MRRESEQQVPLQSRSYLTTPGNHKVGGGNRQGMDLAKYFSCIVIAFCLAAGCDSGPEGATDSDTSETGEVETVPCGDELPPEGSPCEEDAYCAPDADPCSGYEFAECVDGSWEYGRAGRGNC